MRLLCNKVMAFLLIIIWTWCWHHVIRVDKGKLDFFRITFQKLIAKLPGFAIINACLKGQTLIQNKPSISEGYFSASLEKALFCGLSWILSLSMFCNGFSNFYRIMNLQTTGKVLYWHSGIEPADGESAKIDFPVFLLVGVPDFMDTAPTVCAAPAVRGYGDGRSGKFPIVEVTIE